MATLISDIIKRAQDEAKAAADPGIKPDSWLRWFCDGVTEIFSLLEPSRRMKPDLTLFAQEFTEDNADSEIPSTLTDVTLALQRYVEYRYHARLPKNTEEREAANSAYADFLRLLGVKT